VNNLQSILSQSLFIFILVPLLAFILSLFFQNKQEKPIARIVLFTKAFYILASFVYLVLWMINGSTPLGYRLLTIYQTDQFVFAIQFYYDLITAVYSVVGAILFFLVSTFSRYYMHRDEGYKRFFNTILFFALGYNLIIFSGNFETLFVGWEFIGLSSFLLIAFYRNRYLPVKNAFKVLSNYRLSDLALILAMWMMHHLTHQNISFSQLEEARAMAVQNDHPGMAVFIVLMVILASAIKSAQVPFTSWLPRAMEGPTTSSAIFYGSLSVHIGVFVLLRTWPFWQDMLWAKIAVIVIGALTAVIASLIARVQPTVKTQIAYSSAAQIGFIFIEVALGWHVLALIHFAGNAFLRTYQLLVSPSVLNYLVHHQYFHYHPPVQKALSKLAAGLYVLGIKEWNLDGMMHNFFWRPFKWLGSLVQFFRSGLVATLLFITCVAALILSIVQPDLGELSGPVLSACLLAIAFAVILFSFSFRGSALKAWSYLLLAHLFIISGIGINAAYINIIEFLFYGSGIALAFVLGFYCLKKTEAIDNDIMLNRHHGYVYEQKNTALLFFLAAIGMLGFPITAAFIGIDVLFTYVDAQQVVSITLLALCLIFIELAAIRIFLRIFLGPHKKLDHPIAFRSS
jgi:NADH:ubiquinone oxidoreductase subunit 5 (subunit L)/multisubunit Na+/H+ antiporter MnhA subunit